MLRNSGVKTKKKKRHCYMLCLCSIYICYKMRRFNYATLILITAKYFSRVYSHGFRKNPRRFHTKRFCYTHTAVPQDSFLRKSVMKSSIITGFFLSLPLCRRSIVAVVLSTAGKLLKYCSRTRARFHHFSFPRHHQRICHSPLSARRANK